MCSTNLSPVSLPKRRVLFPPCHVESLTKRAEEYLIESTESYHYLNQSGNTSIDNVDDQEDFLALKVESPAYMPPFLISFTRKE